MGHFVAAEVAGSYGHKVALAAPVQRQTLPTETHFVQINNILTKYVYPDFKLLQETLPFIIIH